MSDIKPRGSVDGKGRYWIKHGSGIPGAQGSLRLVLIDDAGNVELTPVGLPWDDAAMTKDEAIQHHLRGAVAEADQVLERRRRDAPPAPPEPKPPPVDAPTRRFLDNDTVVCDLNDPRSAAPGFPSRASASEKLTNLGQQQASRPTQGRSRKEGAIAIAPRKGTIVVRLPQPPGCGGCRSAAYCSAVS